MVDLDLYRVFYTVAKCGSLTKAAEELYISQPAVSQAIKQLESQLGGKLFNRVSRGMELTETGGKQMFDIVEQALKMLDSAEDRFRERRNIATGQIRIAAADTIVTHFLMRYIKKYHEIYPNVNIIFKNSTTKEALDMIKSNKADIGMVNLPIYDKDVIMTGQTGIIEDIFVASDKYKELFDKNLSLRDLPDYPVLMLDGTTSTTKEINDFFDSMSIKIVPEFEAGSIELLIEMAKNGLGIACVPRRYVLDELAKKELHEVKVTPSLPLRATGVIIRGEIEEHSFAVKEFIKVLDDDQYNEVN
ncbi:MAG: LysR family transcriptional regulator [Candidatus Borkfalkiaceae bacterium]|nr:LysR family transcriptional regulator [Eubacteriales bacterium]MDY5820777.1 LysR family transcriptional regulator [Christensenellaceae bacterium]